MSNTYGYLLDGDCLPAFVDSGRDRRKLLAWFEELAETPFQTGDYEEVTPAGRRVQVSLREDWLISFWSDHAVKKVWIVELVKVQGT